MEKQQSFVDAKKEMVRVDHLIFVSLKYSRTVDVIKSVIKRLISSYEMAMKGLLESAFEGEKLKQAMHGPKTMRDAVASTYPETAEYMEFYRFLRELDKAKVNAKLNEFRRHVTLVTSVDEEEHYVKIETVEEYYEKTKKFIDLVDKLIHK
ncbi:hypothetical protein KY311_03765 [Candidatus Woesearchaeota archaeon]|nr:hypothetical protein [Candidatus Woesearchaeota archaeon]MBW3017045.1 hypothetical protein [Candidatus Woesearchaeota archaeon]